MKKIILFLIGSLLCLQSYALEVVKVETTETIDPVTLEVLSTTDSLVFDPSVLVDPVTTAVIAAICAVAGIVLIVLGARWVFRLCKGGY